jgi:hypothetical protein
MTLTLTPEEQTVLADIRQAGGFRSDEDAVKGALWWYARFLDLEPSPDLFALAPSVPCARMMAPDGDQGELFIEARS